MAPGAVFLGVEWGVVAVGVMPKSVNDAFLLKKANKEIDRLWSEIEACKQDKDEAITRIKESAVAREGELSHRIMELKVTYSCQTWFRSTPWFSACSRSRGCHGDMQGGYLSVDDLLFSRACVEVFGGWLSRNVKFPWAFGEVFQCCRVQEE